MRKYAPTLLSDTQKHGPTSMLSTEMSITVVGSIAFDAVTTPFGQRERMLGGAAVHFALAAAFFDDVRVVGPVGDDFGEHEYAVLRERGVITDDIEQIADGKTFFWRGEYHSNLNVRDTLETDLNVFEHFQPKLSPAAQNCDVLFLANIQPELQQTVRVSCKQARFAALDSMDLWINIARDALEEVIRNVDCVILNDEELEQLTGKHNVLSASRELLSWGPSAIVAKQGKYGAALITNEGFFSLPAFPMETVIDPTGAGDSFAGGFVGYVAAHPDQPITHNLLSRAMAYGTALASYNVQEFGTERVARLTPSEVRSRVGELQRITNFSDEPPVQLRG